jgi:hypothetical protein
MSVATVRAFWQKALQDPALQRQLASLQEKEPPATTRAVVQLAAAAGFPFTVAD